MTPPGTSDFNPVSDSPSDAKPSEQDSPSTEDQQGGEPKNTLTLDQDMEEDGGLTGAEDGDIYTFTVRARKAGPMWIPMSVMGGKQVNEEMDRKPSMGDDDESDKPAPGVRSPSDLGMEKMMS